MIFFSLFDCRGKKKGSFLVSIFRSFSFNGEIEMLKLMSARKKSNLHLLNKKMTEKFEVKRS